MLFQFIQLHVPIGLAAPAAILLIGPQHTANGTLGSKIQLVNNIEHLPGSHTAAAVIMGALTHIPTVNMSTHNHHFIGVFIPFDLTDHITRYTICNGTGVHF